MNSRAARWVDELFPRVAVRQFVLTVPWPRRWLLARRPELVKGVLKIGLREVFRWYQRRAISKGLQEAKCGSVTVVQRFGSALNLNIHFHCLMMDGVYGWDPKVKRIVYQRLGGIRTKDVELLVVRIAQKAERWLSRQGYGQHDELFDDPDDALASLQGAAVAGRVATGKKAGQKALRVQLIQGKEYKLPPKCATYQGYNLHAGVVAKARDRKGLEGLCRYIMRPPLAKDRLRYLGGGKYDLRLKTPWSDGTTSLRLSRLEMMERLAALVPPPRAHQVLYHGLFAPRSKWRSKVLPQYRKEAREERKRKMHRKLVKGDSEPRENNWVSWAYLLRRVFDFDGCAACVVVS